MQKHKHAPAGHRYNLPPSYAMPFAWMLELRQRTVDRDRFPDTRAIYDNNYKGFAYARREPDDQHHAFQQVYRGPFAYNNTHDAPQRYVNPAASQLYTRFGHHSLPQFQRYSKISTCGKGVLY